MFVGFSHASSSSIKIKKDAACFAFIPFQQVLSTIIELFWEIRRENVRVGR